ncbi:acetyltransferase, N-acetylglutamate synthase [Desulfosporosinus orientis DSM 765]|uniref:Acetyltransferase, N-acetylglutamate synthase n=1 Tax=Desulfosporosinus orientis (strain ATCC 19365 / DSM 765 / NCIMB 8382 / VKM B-1628 / Singapore I) TaxID=768706 RepID=G7WFT1_DESOD|nr:N-acetyltransferase [Desulfosporosinus orientis]AET68954.1 acetyltransferase, N-acetylglutamate synthase [Desulfosporosinus orientis DSM 765]
MKLRKARISDVEAMMLLINSNAQEGLMLPRSRNMLYENIREFLLAEVDDQLVGVASLHILWSDLAEIRALAVATGYKRRGIGSQIVKTLEDEARELGIARVFALTYQPEFFKYCGYEEVNKEQMPQKVWNECINCIKFPNCDEIAVSKTL